MADNVRKCDVCLEHSAHGQALASGNERFKEIDRKLDTLLTWKAEMRGMWLLTICTLGLISSVMGVIGGVLTTYKVLHADTQNQEIRR